MTPVPADVGRTVEQATEPPLVHGLADLHHRLVETVLVACTDLDVMLSCFLNYCICILYRQCYRFLNNDVYASSDALQGDRGMLSALGADGDQLGLLFVEHQLIVIVLCNFRSIQFELKNLVFKHGCIDVTQANYLKFVCLGCGQMVRGDSPAADQCISHHSTSMLSRFLIAFITFLVSKIALACCCTKP